MTIQVIMADREQHAPQIRELFWAQWVKPDCEKSTKSLTSPIEGDMRVWQHAAPGTSGWPMREDLAGMAFEAAHAVSRSNGCTRPGNGRPSRRTLVNRLLQAAQHSGIGTCD
jgi:hypothetical protein